LYLQGILSDVARKNGWQLAEQAGESCPDGMQRLLSTAVWDENGVRDELRSYVMAHLTDPYAVVAIDETSFPKRGNQSAGVAPQYCGSTKQVENCQVGVFLSYISSRGHTLLDRELYLPRHWLQDRARCEKAGIPETVSFQTKCELARAMMERLHQAQIPVAWVVADTVYGNNLDLRTWLEDHHYWFAPLGRLDRTDWGHDRARTHAADSGAGRATVRQRAGVAALQCEDGHQRTAAFRVGMSAHLASKGAMTGSIGCSFVASQRTQQTRPITWSSALLAPSFR